MGWRVKVKPSSRQLQSQLCAGCKQEGAGQRPPHYSSEVRTHLRARRIRCSKTCTMAFSSSLLAQVSQGPVGQGGSPRAHPCWAGLMDSQRIVVDEGFGCVQSLIRGIRPHARPFCAGSGPSGAPKCPASPPSDSQVLVSRKVGGVMQGRGSWQNEVVSVGGACSRVHPPRSLFASSQALIKQRVPLGASSASAGGAGESRGCSPAWWAHQGLQPDAHPPLCTFQIFCLRRWDG